MFQYIIVGYGRLWLPRCRVTLNPKPLAILLKSLIVLIPALPTRYSTVARRKRALHKKTNRLQEAVVLPLPTIEIQSEPISPTSEVPASSEAATSEDLEGLLSATREFVAERMTATANATVGMAWIPANVIPEQPGMLEEASAAEGPEVAEGESHADRGEEDADAKSFLSASFDLGVHVLRLPAFVAPSADIFEPDDDELIAELEEGEEIELVEIVGFPEEGRVRGKLKSPEGWITLRNSATGANWIAVYSEARISDHVSQEGGQVSEGKSEASVSEQDPTAPYKKGVYILVRAAYVAPDADNFAPDDDELVARVEEGEEVEVVEVVDFVEEDRVRGRILEPGGWITLLNRITGTEWIMPKEPGDHRLRGDRDESSEEEGDRPSRQDGKEEVDTNPVDRMNLEDSCLQFEEFLPLDFGHRKASELEQEEPYEAGIYLLVRSAFVAYDADNFTPDDDELVAELEEGEEVEVVEVIDFVEDDRVRGRLHDPDGWITLMNRATGAKWVALKESDNDFRGASKTATSEPGEQEEASHSEDQDGDESSRHQRVVEEADERPTEMKWTSPEDSASIDAEAEGGRKPSSAGEEAEDPPVPFEIGSYVLLRTAFVALDADNFSPDDEELVAELEEGEEVEVVEVVDFVKEERVRGRLRDFDGWITLLNRATGTEWVAPATKASKDSVDNDARGAGDREASRSQEEDPPVHFKTGSYVLLRPTFVALDADDFSPDDADLVAKLEEGMEVEVVEVVDFVKEERVRGRLRDFDGWITLLNRATGTEWVAPATQESVDDGAQGESQRDASSDVEAASEHSRPATVVDDGVDAPPGSDMKEDSREEDDASVDADAAGTDDREASHSEEEEEQQQEDSSVRFKTGSYVLLRPAFVALHADDFSPDDDELVAELEEGMEVEVVEVVDFVKEERVRGRLRDFDGWITLLNRATGTEWVAPTTNLPPSKDSVDNDPRGEEGSEPEAEIAQEPSIEPEEPDEPTQGSPTMLPGLYILLRPAFVSPEAKIFAPEDDELIAELEEGQEIEVTEIIDFESEKRVRGKLKDPDGWITLMSKATGAKWVAAKVLPEDAEYTGDGEASEPGEDRTPLSRRVSFHEADEGESEPASGDSDPEREGDVEPEEAAGIEPAEPGPKGRRKLFDVGLYVLRRPAFVSPRAELFEPDDDELVAELEEGEEIEIVEVVDFRNLGRVRGKLKSPEGWITLRNSATGIKWVAPKEESASDQQAQDLDQDPPPYPKGFYVLMRSAYVAYDADNFAPDDDELVAELEEGDEVEIVEVVDFVEEERVRGRLYDPDGWITLLNRATGAEWVTPKVEVDAGSRGESDDDYSYSEDEDGNPRPRRQRMAYDVGEHLESKFTLHLKILEALVSVCGLPAGAVQTIVKLSRDQFIGMYVTGLAMELDDDEVVEELEEGELPRVQARAKGQEVRAVEIVELKDGWVTFANTATGVRRVVAKEEWLETRTAESWASGDIGDAVALFRKSWDPLSAEEEETDSASESERLGSVILSNTSEWFLFSVLGNSGDMIPSFADVGTVHTDGDLLSRSNQGELAPTPKFKQLYPEGRQDSRKTQSEADEQTDDEAPSEDEPE
ncbi:unnamed protein product [Symbiodinium sp. CCMP2592]|nr:unnamed protein product [Symbiodinium sp. CCMP2592]